MVRSLLSLMLLILNALFQLFIVIMLSTQPCDSRSKLFCGQTILDHLVDIFSFIHISISFVVALDKSEVDHVHSVYIWIRHLLGLT
jgi:hypothetical protein